MDRNQEENGGKIAEGSVQYVVNELEGLVKEIVAGRAVIYVGAGLSQSADLISWNELLADLQDKARGRLENDNAATSYFNELKKRGRSLEVGDWLLDVLKPAGFCQAVEESISRDRHGQIPVPSTVHQHLTRLPFSMAITTNYDSLLEDAYKSASIEYGKVLTWRDAQQTLAAVKASKFKIVHAHGVLDDPETIVLSGSQYAEQQHSRPQSKQQTHQLRFGDVFKWLLKTKTFLFLGAGLEDPDLIFHLQEVKAEHGDAVGEHYALLPYHEAPRRRREILYKNLNVKVIPFGSEEEKRVDENGWMGRLLTGILRELSGQVALKKFNNGLPQFPTSDDPRFCLYVALRKLLDDAVNITGSLRGDFCLPPGPESHGSGFLQYVISTEMTDPEIIKARVHANSICGIAHYQSAAEYGVYVANVNDEPLRLDSRLGHYGEIEYKRGYSGVNSELAMPIESDGVRVGVLNLESKLIDAYSPCHRETARKFAEKAGRLYAAANERQRRARRLAPARTYPAYGKMREVCARLWRIARDHKDGELELALLIYHADYRSGLLESQDPVGTIFTDPKKKIEPPRFVFHHPSSKNDSLAARVYHYGRPFSYPDAAQAISEGNLPSNSYPTLFEIRGPLIGFPVSIHGHISGVVVSWLRNAPMMELDGRDIDLFRRASHVMANCFQFKHEEGPAEDEPRFTSIERVTDILECIEHPSAPLAMDNEFLNEVGKYFRAEIGGALTSFLNIVSSNEAQFAKKMETWYKSRPRPTLWIAPRRCRCWVRAGKTADGKPRFLLALEVSTEGKHPYRNLITSDSKPLGVAMQPFMSSKDDAARAMAKRPHSRKSELEPVDVDVTIGGQPYHVKSRILYDNKHLSFLLSRVSVYPFAFLQKPGVIGIDVMSDVLEKDSTLPWVVCPLIVSSPGEWAGSPADYRASEEQRSKGYADRCLAGYLTFDNGWHDIREPGIGDLPGGRSVEVTDQWASFQNDLIHQTDLFAACLAHRKCFRSLLEA